MHLNNCLTEEPLTFAKKTLSTTFSFLTFSLKILPGLAAMQPFLLHCLSLQALRRGAGRRRKGLVFQKNAAFRENPEIFWQKCSKILTKFAICFVKNQQIFQQFLTKKLRLENGAKEQQQQNTTELLWNFFLRGFFLRSHSSRWSIK